MHGVVADDRRGLRGAVALEDPHAQELPFSAQLVVEGRAAGDDEVELAAELLVHGAKEMTPQAEGRAPGSLEQGLPGPLLALARHLSFDAVHQQLQRLRHHQHGGDSAFPHGAGQDGGLPAGGIRDAGAGVERHQEAAHLLVHVAEGEDGQEPAGRRDGNVLGDALYVRCEVAMGDHHPLGSPVVPDVNMISARSLFVDGDGIRVGKARYGRLELLEGNLRDVEVHLSLGRETGGEGHLGVGARYDPGDVVGRAAKVQGHENDARSQAAEEGQDPVGRVGAPEDGLVSLAESLALEEGGHPAGVFPEAAVRPAQVPEGGLDEKRVPRPVSVDRFAQEVDDGPRHRCNRHRYGL